MVGFILTYKLTEINGKNGVYLLINGILASL